MFQNQNKFTARLSGHRAMPGATKNPFKMSYLQLSPGSQHQTQFALFNKIQGVPTPKMAEQTPSRTKKQKFKFARKYQEGCTQSPCSNATLDTCASSQNTAVSDFTKQNFAQIQDVHENSLNLRQIEISDCDLESSSNHETLSCCSSHIQQQAHSYKFRSAVVHASPPVKSLLVRESGVAPLFKFDQQSINNCQADQETLTNGSTHNSSRLSTPEDEIISDIESDGSDLLSEIEKQSRQMYLTCFDQQHQEKQPARPRDLSHNSCNHSQIKELKSQKNILIKNPDFKKAERNGSQTKSIIDKLFDPLTSRSGKHNFTPSTPYVHKFRTEMCKNFELYGKCKFGDECSFAHGKQQMMLKKDVSALYKTKDCKKYMQNGYCPYGQRCQFIHRETNKTPEVSNHSEQAYVYQEVEQVGPHIDKVAIVIKKYENYNDIVEHCINVSFQEHQKKQAMFKKMTARKNITQLELELSGVYEPEFQYMNIYQSPRKRLSTFDRITSQPYFSGEGHQYHHCDASQYESVLDQQIKRAQYQRRTNQQTMQMYYSQQVAQPQYIPPQNIMVHNIMMEKLSRSKRNGAAQTSSSLFKDLPTLDQLTQPSKSNLKLSQVVFRPTFVPKV